MVFDAETKMASVRVKRGNLSGKIRNKEEFGKGGAGYLMVSIVLLALSGATMLMPWIAPIVWIVAGIFVWISDIKGIARDHLSWQPFKEADSKTEVKVPLLALLLSVLAAGVIGSIGWLRPLYNMIVLENFSLATLQEKISNFSWNNPGVPFTSMEFAFGIHAACAALLLLASVVMHNKKKPSWHSSVCFIHNVSMCIFSIIMLILLIAGGILENRFSSADAFLCHRPQTSSSGLVSFTMYMFYLTKIMELFDTFLTVLAKRPIWWLHIFHHFSTASLVMHANSSNHSLDLLCAGLNCFCHIAIYMYLTRPCKTLRWPITFLQIVQFVIVLASSGYVLLQRYSGSPCDGTMSSEMHCIIMYCIYLGLFANFFIQNYVMKNKKDPRAGPGATMIFKTFMCAVVGILCIRTLPWYFLPVGVLITSSAMSWLYIMGQNCCEQALFRSSFLNRVVGTIILLPLLRPFSAVVRNVGQGAPWSTRLLKKLYGISISHVFVWTFIGLFFPIMTYTTGISGVVKYWLLPFLWMHYKMGTFSSRETRPSYMLLYPQLRKLVENETEQIRQDLHTLRTVPLDQLKRTVDQIFGKDAVRNVQKRIGFTNPIQQIVDFYNEAAEIVMREMILWKGWRDLVLYVAAAVFLVMTFQRYWITACIPLILTLFFSTRLNDGFTFVREQINDHWEEINWPMGTYITLVHIWGVIGFAYMFEAKWQTLLWGFILWPISGLGITAGAHRLWSHRSYKASLPLRVFLMLANSIANQGSLLHWSRDHRVHHKHSETPADPHNALRGFFFAHMGWLYVKKAKEVREAGKKINFDDLYNDPVVMLQKKLDPWFALFMCFVFPGLFSLYWGESFWTGFWVAGALRYMIVLHFTWLVNSAAHLWGSRPYDPQSNPSENGWVSIAAIGEGWHNWHHAFPFDYAASELGISLQFNPTKLFIDVCVMLGLAWDCKRATTMWKKREKKFNDEGKYAKLTGPLLFRRKELVEEKKMMDEKKLLDQKQQQNKSSDTKLSDSTIVLGICFVIAVAAALENGSKVAIALAGIVLAYFLFSPLARLVRIVREQAKTHWNDINWAMGTYITLVHVWGFIGFAYIFSAQWQTLLWGFILWPISGLGITAGAHRLWSHRSYKAGLPLRTFLMLANSIANQGSILHWSRDHRVHHKHSETPADPHNALRGFFFAHMGWLYVKKAKEVKEAGKKINFDDLYSDPVVWLQKMLDPWFALFMCFVFPGLVSLYWGERFWTGFWVAGAFRYMIVLHFTWLVNSAAHLWGSRPYDPQSNPAENGWVSIAAIGEGWHNWHHAFPFDYAASELGISQQFNPTKLFIDVCVILGLAWDCKRATNMWKKREEKFNEDGKFAKLTGPVLFRRKELVAKLPRQESVMPNNWVTLISLFVVHAGFGAYLLESGFNFLWLGPLLIATCVTAPLMIYAIHQLNSHWDEINWPMGIYITLVHIWGVIGFAYIFNAHWQTLLWGFILWPISGLGITAGAHRLWSHRSYKASLPVRVFLMLANSIANQGSILHWSRDHRVHHKHSETPADPHNALRGFFFAHMGWLYVKKAKEVKEAGMKINFDDLYNDPVVMLQRKLDPWFALFMCFVFPGLVSMNWGENFWTGLWVAGAFRYMMVLHFTWLVNSAAHLWGSRPYDPQSNPAENGWVSIAAIGEGWHNWHHAFPFDYSASELGISQQFNPTKLFIDVCVMLGLAWDRKRAVSMWEKREKKFNKEGKVAKLTGPVLFRRKELVDMKSS